MTWAVHRLHGVVAFFRFGGEHGVLVMFPVAGFLPQCTVNNLRRFDLKVTGITLYFTHVLLKHLIHGPAIRVPEHHTWRFFLQVEQVQLLCQLTVIAFFRFFDAGNIVLQILLIVPCSTVNTLQLFVLRITAPVGTGYTLQFEYAHNTGIRNVRTTTHVDVFFVVVQAHRLFALLDQIIDQFDFVIFTTVYEDTTRVFNRRHFFYNVVVFLDQLFYAFFNRGDIFRCKWTFKIDVVIKAVVDHRANSHLSGWVQLLNSMTNQVSERVTDNFQTFLITTGDQGNFGVFRDQFTGINQLAVDTATYRRFRQTRADVFGNLHQGYGLSKFAFGTIRKGNNRHIISLSVVAPTTGHMNEKRHVLYRAKWPV